MPQRTREQIDAGAALQQTASGSASGAGRIVLAVDNSQLVSFLTCPRQWQLQYLKSIKPKRLDTLKVSPLDKGTVVHALLDTYYKARALGNNPNDALGICFRTLDKGVELGKIPEIPKTDINFIKNRFGVYVANYLTNDYRPLCLDGIPQVEVGFSIPLIDTLDVLFVLEGRIDLITEQMFVDHKSQDRTYNHYPYDTQFLTYALATGLKLGAINYFGLQETINANTFRRQQLSFQQDHLDRWREKVIYYMWRMAECIELNHYEHNEKSCSGQWGHPCPYTKIDEIIDESIAEQVEQQYYEVVPRWEPWSLAEIEKML